MVSFSVRLRERYAYFSPSGVRLMSNIWEVFFVMIELKNLSKTFRVARRNGGMKEAIRAFWKREYAEIRALDHVSFSIGDGEMVGYIGPNGAGKSSTIKIMSGILLPDISRGADLGRRSASEEGTCVIDGLVPWKNRREHVQNLGVVFGQRSQLWWDVPVLDSYALIKDIYRIDDRVYRRNLDELTECLGLSEILRTPVRQLSLGQRMRCEIAASLLHDPRILFLDEPTIGLDAVSKIAVRDFIRRRNRDHGTTVILTTHDMQDIEALTERILLIGKGKILLDGSLSALKARHDGVRKLTVTYSGVLPKAASPLPDGLTCLSEEMPTDGAGQFAFGVDTEVLGVSAAIGELSARFEITDLSVAGTTAEELVVSLYREFAI